MLYRISVTERGLTGIANIFRSRLSRLDDLLGAGTVPLSNSIWTDKEILEVVSQHTSALVVHRSAMQENRDVIWQAKTKPIPMKWQPLKRNTKPILILPKNANINPRAAGGAILAPHVSRDISITRSRVWNGFIWNGPVRTESEDHWSKSNPIWLWVKIWVRSNPVR